MPLTYNMASATLTIESTSKWRHCRVRDWVCACSRLRWRHDDVPLFQRALYLPPSCQQLGQRLSGQFGRRLIFARVVFRTDTDWHSTRPPACLSLGAPLFNFIVAAGSCVVTEKFRWVLTILHGSNIYTLCLKKVLTRKLSVTLSNLNRFSNFLNCWKAYEIFYRTDTTLPTSH